MKKFTGIRIIQKISLIFIVFVLLFQFMMPIKSEAIDLLNFETPGISQIFRFMSHIVASGGDLVMSGFNKFLLGTKGFGTAMIDNETLGNGSWFDNDGLPNNYSDSLFDNDTITIGQEGDKVVIYVKADSLENNILANSENWEIPNLLYLPHMQPSQERFQDLPLHSW